MATIRLKKRAASGAAGAPSSLAPSEIAFNEADKKLYYGFGDDGSGGASSILSIAGEGAVMHLGNVNQTAAGNKTFTGNVVVGGNLTVNGTTSTLSTTNSVVADKIIELGNGVSGVPSGDSGIVIERGSSSNAFMGWDESADKFLMGTGSFTGASTGNLTVTKGTLSANIDGDVVGNVTGNVTGNASTATQLANTRTFSLTGDVTGSATFNGSGNASIASTIGSGAVDLAMLSASGTKNSSTFLRGDNTFATIPDTNTTSSISCVDGDSTDEEKIRLTESDGTTDDVVIEAGTGLTIARSGDKITLSSSGTQNTTGNAATATRLQTARLIGGVSFNGTANINLPGVNAAGNQNTSGNAATATQLQTARTIGGVSFNGTGNINLPGVNVAGNQNTTGSSGSCTGNAATATKLATARTIAGVSFDGSSNISLNTNALTNGAGFVTSSIINSLNASNLSSGTVPAARIGTVDGGTF